MEHIRQFDWCYSQPDIYFLKEDDMAHSVTEKILRNKFRNPIISSDSEEEGETIDWDEIFTKNQNFQFEKFHRQFVPCLAQCPPPYPKLSAIDGRQQYQCLKVLCADYPDILPQEFIPRPTKSDLRVFEELKEKYENEQKEYIEWAKTLWTNSHCVRALHPKPHVETVYEAMFKMKANEMISYPKMYNLAAQIPLETCKSTFEMVLDKDLKKVNIKTLPQIEIRPLTKRFTIIRACNVPEPCTKHPCKFILPNEKSVSILPLTEVQRELAQYGLDNDAHYVVSENALKCLVEQDRIWDISVAVCPVIGPDGDSTNIVVLGSEFSIHKESVLMRTYRAFRHLLQHSIIPPSEKSKLNYKEPKDSVEETEQCTSVSDKANSIPDLSVDMDSDEEDNSLCIDEDMQNLFDSEDDAGQGQIQNEEQNDKIGNNNDIQDDKTQSDKDKKQKNQNKVTNDSIDKDSSKSKRQKQNSIINEDSDDFYSCTCKDTLFERPPPRSFRKWRVRNKTTNENYNVIVHCAHKVRDKNGEVILEPIPEYQLELGGSAQARGRIRSLALSLYLRENASLMNVRVDGDTGEVATFEGMSSEQLSNKHGDVMSDVISTLHTAFSQLQGLLPGNYLLRHQPSHGANALLYAAKPSINPSFTLDFDCTKLEDSDESKSLKTPPTLVPVLLPFHKFRKILPCAFTPHEHMLPRAPRRAPARNKTPPRALQLDAEQEGGARSKWPKRKNKKKKKANAAN
ncbi:uncharacterized protein LOC123866477 isoform X2 [Maniola jurtina]|uniref:uncharacterized protein LOC123866477 isoform X2 n=1 Tax=Maniola jurtina TaxID=191418 RepID=UPI001E689E9B|nr:uncharacterized protein LOC123866477 isoform X2 [Maniola jurtina]